MPIYEYRCAKCGHGLEALQKISDAPLRHCPSCHEESLQKLVSAASFRLKGGGWYETDFKKDKKKQLADSGGGDADTKPDAGKGTDKQAAETAGGKSATADKTTPATGKADSAG